MKFLVGVKDQLAKAYIQTLVIDNPDVFKREIKNVVNTPSKSPMFTDAEDFQCDLLCEVDELTGKVTSNKKKLFDFASLKSNNAS